MLQLVLNVFVLPNVVAAAWPGIFRGFICLSDVVRTGLANYSLLLAIRNHVWTQHCVRCTSRSGPLRERYSVNSSDPELACVNKREGVERAKNNTLREIEH